MTDLTTPPARGHTMSINEDTDCGLCWIKDPYLVAAGYEASIITNRTPDNPEWRQLGPARQARLEELVAGGLTAHHHQCCVIFVLLDGRTRCPACAASRTNRPARHHPVTTDNPTTTNRKRRKK